MDLRKNLKSNTWFSLIFFFIMAMSVFIGYEFYKEQLAAAPFYLWVFIPDCPFYALLALFAFYGMVRSDTFDLLASTGMIKYGLWTLLVFALYPAYYFSPSLLAGTTILIVGHTAMVLAGIILFIPKHVDWKMTAIMLGWFLLNDFMDYWVGVHPTIPTEKMETVIVFTVAESVFIPILIYLWHVRVKTR